MKQDVNSPGRGAPAIVSLALQRFLRSGDGLLEFLPVGIYTCDLQGNLVQYNRRAAELWGRAPDLNREQCLFCGAHRLFLPSGEELPHGDTPMAQALAKGEAAVNREVIVERPDGSRITVLVNITPLRDEAGNVVGAVNCFQDITERKRAETRLAARERFYHDLLEALPTAVYTTDDRGRVTFYNQAAVDLAGREPKLGADKWCVNWRLFQPDGTPLAHEDCPMAVTLKTGEPVRGVEAIAERPDGSRVPFLPYPTPLRDESGQLIGAVNVMVDISERKRAEEQKNLLLRELAHRVNNTFAVIQAMTQQSLRTTDSMEEFAETFSGRLQALARAHNLLLASDWRGADLGELARAQVGPLVPGAEDRFTMEGPPVQLDSSQVIALAIILHELGTNACKHGALSEPGGTVKLAWDFNLNGRGRLRLSWTERNGPKVHKPLHEGLGTTLIRRGMPNATIDWSFEPEGVACRLEMPVETPRPGRRQIAQAET
jgi:PAS domain S-box-containing protein